MRFHFTEEFLFPAFKGFRVLCLNEFKKKIPKHHNTWIHNVTVNLVLSLSSLLFLCDPDCVQHGTFTVPKEASDSFFLKQSVLTYT